MQKWLRIFFLCISVIISSLSFGQPNTNVDLDNDKPKQYENRVLGSEKTGKKKFNIVRRFTQNTYTHFNYYFNANQKLIEIIETAKKAFKDDYTQLLPFYNYTLDGTAQSKGDIDSIIYKCTSGILLHDLRNDWIDNLYMVMGKAYLMRKDFDSAAGCFQYINYVYAPKDEGYDIPLGSNASNTNGVFTISTKEKRSVLKKLTSRPPSRNESFIWQIRNYLEQDMLGEAAGLIGILRNDPYFPKRLKTDLHEMTAYWFYKQQSYDSAAYHLQKSLDNAEDKAEKARWEYLAGQMYQLAKNDSLSLKMYNRSVAHAIDPLMEVYARLNIVSLSTGKKKNALQDNLDELIKLAKRDKYESYRDIIYYAAALLELQRNSIDAANNNLSKSVKYSVDNPTQKNKSLLLLADINYDAKKYIDAKSYYDSIQVADTKTFAVADKNKISTRKDALGIIVKNLKLIQREDSLQKIAAMPEPERTAFIKKVIKQLRKAKGLKGSGTEEGSYNTPLPNNNNADLFSDDKGDWYFQNSNVKSKGFNEFKSKWGKRTNVDNWRRQSALDKLSSANKKLTSSLNPSDVDDTPLDNGNTKNGAKKIDASADEVDESDISFEAMMSRLPLTKENIDLSNSKLETALYSNGETFQNKLEDYPSAIEAYDALIKRFTKAKKREEALFNLYYCYNKIGLKTKADSIKAMMNQAYPNGKETQKLNSGNHSAEKQQSNAVTQQYATIYQLFIEGRFQEAIQQKKKLDSVHGKTYWTPQLLFIESIYYVKQNDDSQAITKLNEIIATFPKSPLAGKAITMADVLRRRKEIETYLTNLKVERVEDEASRPVDLDTVSKSSQAIQAKQLPPSTTKSIDNKSTITGIQATPAADPKKEFVFVATDAHYVILVLDKVDRIFVKESVSAFDQYNRQKFYAEKIPVSSIALNADTSVVLMGPFDNAGKAVDYADKVMPVSASKIISWLPADKFKFNIISQPNLTLLLANNDLAAYFAMMKQALPNKF